MNTQNLEKQTRLVPLFCFMLILLGRNFFETTEPIFLTVGALVLSTIAVGSILFRIYLEKQNGTFVAKKYYIFYFFMALSTFVFLYNFFMID